MVCLLPHPGVTSYAIAEGLLTERGRVEEEGEEEREEKGEDSSV